MRLWCRARAVTAALWCGTVVGCGFTAATETGAAVADKGGGGGQEGAAGGQAGPASGAAGGARSKGPACKHDPATFCAGTKSGRWCVEQPFDDQRLSLSVWSDGPEDAWVVGSDIGPDPRSEFLVARWDGCQWKRFANPDPGPFNPEAVWGSGPDDVWIAGRGDHALHFDGSNLQSVPLGDEFTMISAVSGSSRDDVWAAGTQLFHWNGAAWTPVVPGANSFSTFADVWAVAANDVWTIDLRDALHFDGTRWTSTRLTDAQGVLALQTIWAARDDAFAATEDDDVFWRLKNGVWTQHRGSRNSGFRCLGGLNGDIHACSSGPDGLLAFDGTAFVPVGDAPAIFYLDVWVSESEVWAAGVAGTVIHRSRQPGQRPSRSPTPPPVPMSPRPDDGR